ncbi:MAG: nucleotide pyrophosphohydrolase [Desulfotomaculum sp.]|nr:nucleotide pyrophosphohydrolase [Desulfotomaculum sp.]
MKTILQRLISFRDNRNWKQFHNPKDLAISINIEASELLENFQWKTSDEAIKENIENIKDEVADVVIYAILLSNELGFDLEEAIYQKIEKNEHKYPIEKAYGSNKKYSEF